MPHAIEFMNPEFCQRLTLTLMHMLWVGTAIGIVTLTASQCLKRAAARLRYAVNVMGLLVLLAGLPVTYGIVTTSRRDNPASSHGFRMLSPDDPLAVAARNAGLSKIVTADGAFAIPATEVTSLRMIAPYMTACYLAGLAILLGRLAILFGNTSRIRRCATPVDDATLLEQLRQIADRLGLRRIPTLAWSERVGVPSIVGIVRPIILLPMRLATGLGPDEMRAVITHELAHIRRYDPLMHLVQRLAESLLFFHPFVWIISRRVSIERENCCDDAVLASGWQPVDYANSLVRLAELCSVGSTSDLDNRPLALAATGDGSSAFSGRIHRLLGLPPVSRLRPYRSGSLAVAVTGAAVVVAAMLQPVQQTLGEGGSEANELKLTFSGDSKHDPGESIYNDKLRRFKFRLDENFIIVDTPFVTNFVDRYRKKNYPEIIGAFPDPINNSIVVVGSPEAEQSIRTFLAIMHLERDGIPGYPGGYPNLVLKKRQLERDRSNLIQDITSLELAIIGRELRSPDAEKGDQQLRDLRNRSERLENELDVTEQQLAVVVQSLRRIEADLPY